MTSTSRRCLVTWLLNPECHRITRCPEVDFHGEKRCNDTHVSTSAPESRQSKKGKGKEDKLCFRGNVLMENRNDLAVDTRVTLATGKAEREAALAMAEAVTGRRRRITVGADKGYDCKSFVTRLRAVKAAPHVAQRTKVSAIDGRTTRHAGYLISQKTRKRVEEIFGWIKDDVWLRKSRYKCADRIGCLFTFAAATYNMVPMRSLGISVSG